ncbi:MAG TPA: hypothetical protein VE650_19890, partial [Acetobacteraceae bacterium]|nr:hypothetical protein [Acetobacteraceae bacterium]
MDQVSPISSANDASFTPRIDAGTIRGERSAQEGDTRLLAVVAVARHHGVDLNSSDYRPHVGESVPSPASLAAWAKDQGLYAKADRVRWKSLFKLQGSSNPPPPVILLFKDGTAGLMVAADVARNLVWVRDPRSSGNESAVAIDQFRLSQAWGGEVLLIRRLRGESEID